MECREFIYDSSGGVEHSLSINATDKSGAKSNHGDRVIADALACMAMGTGFTPVLAKSEVLPGSLAWRRREEKKKKRLVGASRWQ